MKGMVSDQLAAIAEYKKVITGLEKGLTKALCENKLLNEKLEKIEFELKKTVDLFE